jgi:hypothetical protein
MEKSLIMEKLNEVLEIAKNMLNEQYIEVARIEEKLRNFSYMWMGIVTGIAVLICNSIGNYEKYITTESFLLFSIYQLLGIVYVTSIYFKIYLYKGNYYTNSDIKTYAKYIDSNDTIEDLKKTELGAIQKCIESNLEINQIRNATLTKLKESFKIFLLINIALIVIIFILN